MRRMVAATAIVGSALLIPLEASSGGTAACGPAFEVVPSASVGGHFSNFSDVQAKTSSLAWGVGTWRRAADIDRPLFERWNGTSWVAIKGKNVTKGDNELEGVAVVSKTSVWGVGYAAVGSNASKTLIERWGPKGVQVVKRPSPGVYNGLEDVDALSPTNAVAVGDWAKGNASQALIEHWDGKKWKKVSVKSPPGASLAAVDARSANDIWAVGRMGQNGAERTLIERWNGKAWTVVPSPNRGTDSTPNVLTGVAALSAANVWAVGYISGSDNRRSSLTLHWNGNAWSIVPSPQPGSHQTALASVAGGKATDVWAVGNYTDPTGNYKTMAIHWNGSTWSLSPTPNPSAVDGYHVLSAVTALKSGLVWGAGYYQPSSEY